MKQQQQNNPRSGCFGNNKIPSPNAIPSTTKTKTSEGWLSTWIIFPWNELCFRRGNRALASPWRNIHRADLSLRMNLTHKKHKKSTSRWENFKRISCSCGWLIFLLWFKKLEKKSFLAGDRIKSKKRFYYYYGWIRLCTRDLRPNPRFRRNFVFGFLISRRSLQRTAFPLRKRFPNNSAWKEKHRIPFSFQIPPSNTHGTHASFPCF